MKKVTVAPVSVQRMNGKGVETVADLLAVEEPLEIRLGYGTEENREQCRLAVTMRTPGQDEELATGFLFSEGIIHSPSDLLRVRHCEDVETPEERGNVIRVELVPGLEVDIRRLERHFFTHSACGVCGKASIEAVWQQGCSPLPANTAIFSAQTVKSLPGRLLDTQTVFNRTGGLHAAALFDQEGKLVLMREDIGRHNALDKLIGVALQEALLPLSHYMLLLSGRASFELVQKAILSGIPIVGAVGAPSSLAVQLAGEFGQTLLGFVREDRFNIYTEPNRIQTK